MSISSEDILYKYRNWTSIYHKQVLTKNQLYLASPKDINDPFDCRVPINYALLDTEKKKKNYAKRIIESADSSFFKNTTPEEVIKKIIWELNFNKDEFQKKNNEIHFNGQDKHLGVLSLSKKWDSILMWSHYADMHIGYCVGFWRKKLDESGLFGSGGWVEYPIDDNYPVINPLDEDEPKSILKETQFKAYDWNYEDEYRFTKFVFPNELDRIVNIPDDFFAEIILGLKIPEKDREEIIETAKSKKIKIFQIEQVPFKFLLIRKEIK